MSGRASIKGKGADIFFGDQPDQEATPGEPHGTPGEKEAGEPTSVPPDAQVSRHPNVPTSRRRDIQTSVGMPERSARGQDEDAAVRRFFDSLVLPPALRRRLKTILSSERRIHTTVRFSAEEMAAWRDLMYELEAKRGIKVPRNEVMRMALRLLLDDYELRKEDSLLLQVLKEEAE